VKRNLTLNIRLFKSPLHIIINKYKYSRNQYAYFYNLNNRIKKILIFNRYFEFVKNEFTYILSCPKKEIDNPF